MSTLKLEHTLHFIEGNSNKFYTVQVFEEDDGQFLIRKNWGKIGTDGQYQEKHWADMQSAMFDAGKIAGAKAKKGYKTVEVIDNWTEITDPENRSTNKTPAKKRKARKKAAKAWADEDWDIL